MIENDSSIFAPHEFPMILDRELDTPSVTRSTLPPSQHHSPRPRASVNALIFASIFLVVFLLQIASGAYHSEFNGYPDESAHYVTSLMVRQYITAPHIAAPVPFAQDYYAHYPKVAFGHWPPLLYIVQGIWMSIFSPARASLLLELALTTTLLAYSVYSEARCWLAQSFRSYEVAASVVAALLTITIPLVQIYTAEEMSETLLTLLCFWSAVYFARYIDSSRWQDNCLFGAFFALAVLTKGSGWLLALLPPLSLLFTRKLRLLLRPSFWLAAAIVAVTCIPWQLMTMHLVEEGWNGGTRPSIQYTLLALSGFSVVLFRIAGPALICLAALGVFAKLLLPLRKGTVSSLAAVMFSLIAADWLFHSAVPAGVEDRKLIIAIPAVILFALAGTFWLAYRLPASGPFAKFRLPAVGAAALIIFGVQTFFIPRERHYGYIEAARYLASRSALRNTTILVSSAAGGEGPFIAEVAMLEPDPKGVILRASKVLAHVSFDADVYRQLFPDPASVLRYLKRSHVEFIVLDTFSPRLNFPHDSFLWELVRAPGSFKLVASFPSNPPAPAGQVQLYRLQPQQ